MGEMTAAIEQRLSDAYESLRAAHDMDDDLLAQAQEGEIHDLRRIAADHGIDLRHRA